MKKLIGIFLILIGSMVSVFWGYASYDTIFLKKYSIEQVEERLIEKGLNQKEIDQAMNMVSSMNKNDEIVTLVIMITGIVMMIGGIILFKKGKIDFQLIKRDSIILFLFGAVLITISQTVNDLKSHGSNVLYYFVLVLGLLFVIVSGTYYAISLPKEK